MGGVPSRLGPFGFLRDQIARLAISNMTHAFAVIYDGSIKAPSRSDPSLTTEIKKKGLGVVSAEEYSEPYLDKSKENCVTLDSIRRFKGLEKTIIILTNLDEITRETVKNLYTGLSRARAHLIVISNQKSVNQIKELL